ncbi:MAG: 4Fe-4S binding protein [Leptospirales bacterium]|nr:4Fe-4S binding protein [Leptospirales bacterium]
MAITIYKSKCDGCGTCITNCIMGAISMMDDKAVVNSGRCALCGRCVNECKQRAARYH